MSMPRLGGRPLLEQLREQFPALPVLLISANPGTDPDGAAPELPILQKPIDRDGLLNAIDRATTRVAIL
jgi:CheY-like chemotaxis protein